MHTLFVKTHFLAAVILAVLSLSAPAQAVTCSNVSSQIDRYRSMNPFCEGDTVLRCKDSSCGNVTISSIYYQRGFSGFGPISSPTLTQVTFTDATGNSYTDEWKNLYGSYASYYQASGCVEHRGKEVCVGDRIVGVVVTQECGYKTKSYEDGYTRSSDGKTYTHYKEYQNWECEDGKEPRAGVLVGLVRQSPALAGIVQSTGANGEVEFKAITLNK